MGDVGGAVAGRQRIKLISLFYWQCDASVGAVSKKTLELYFLWRDMPGLPFAHCCSLTTAETFKFFNFFTLKLEVLSRIELRNVVNTVKVKSAKSEEVGYTYKAHIKRIKS